MVNSPKWCILYLDRDSQSGPNGLLGCLYKMVAILQEVRCSIVYFSFPTGDFGSLLVSAWMRVSAHVTTSAVQTLQNAPVLLHTRSLPSRSEEISARFREMLSSTTLEGFFFLGVFQQNG